MTTTTQPRMTRLHQGDADWLYRLLADVREDVAQQPSSTAVQRIRTRLLAQLRTPTKVAA